MTEKLTDEDRKQLLSFGDYGEHAVELIDAHAADRAALVSQLEAAKSGNQEAIRLLRSDESLKVTRAMQALRNVSDVECPGCGYSGKLWEHRCPARETHAALVAQLEAANALLKRSLDKDPMVRRDIRVFFKQPGLVPSATAALVAQRAHCDDHAGWRSDCDRCSMHEPSPAPTHAALVAQLKSAESELRRLGYGEERIFVFTKDESEPAFTSYVGDSCWDSKKNRQRTFQFIEQTQSKLDALVAQVAELTRERDDWKARCMASDELGSGFQERAVKAESEVTRLTEALAAAERAEDVRVRAVQDDYSARLAAAERDCVTNAETADEYLREFKAAEARVRELEEQLNAAKAQIAELTIELGKEKSMNADCVREASNARVKELETELGQLRNRVAKAIRCLRAKGLINKVECAIEALRQGNEQ